MAGEPVSRILRAALNTNNFHQISASNLSLLSALSPSGGILARFGHSCHRKALGRRRTSVAECLPVFFSELHKLFELELLSLAA